MSRGTPYTRHTFERLREAAADLPGAELVERGAEVVGNRVEQGVDVLTEKVGGPARLRVVVLLAAVLGLSSADTGAISAIAPKLETSLHIGNVDIGLLVTVSAVTAALGMLPVGWVTDRWNRTRMITMAVVAWGAAEILSAVSPDYTFLLVVRLALGVLTAVTGPTLASLTGDLFPARERSQIYGYILTGELIGAGFGLLVAGLFSSWFTWRVAFAALAVPSFILAWQFHRKLPEPARGGQSRLERGAMEVISAKDLEVDATAARGPSPAGPMAGDTAQVPSGPETTAAEARRREETEVLREVRRRHIDPRQGVVLERDPMELGWWESFRYVIAVPSNVTLIIASALGYFFFSGVETFALIYIEGHYGTSEGVATIIALGVGAAAVLGAIFGGRITDSLLRRGHLEARLLVPAAAFIVAAVVFVPGIISKTLLISMPLFFVAGFCIAAPNPGLDAARLDIMPSRMWGRAEAVRSLLRSSLQAFAPLLFGLVSVAFGGRSAGVATSGMGQHSHAAATGLEQTFLLMLVTLVAAAFFVWHGRKPYPVDVAAADETERRFPADRTGSDGAGAGAGAGARETPNGAPPQPDEPVFVARPCR